MQLITAALESEKSHCKLLADEVQAKTESAASQQQEIETLKGETVLAAKKVEENSNHIRILATSCNESKELVIAKEKVRQNLNPSVQS